MVECIGDTWLSVLAITQSVSEIKSVIGDVTVGITYKIPIEGIHMLLGNDLALETDEHMSCD